MEKTMTLLYLISALILLASLLELRKINLSLSIKQKIRVIIILLSIFFLLIFLEELSWGQRIFDLKPTGIFAEKNYQNEINIHNFFNPVFKYLYPVIGMGFFISMFFIWFFPKNRESFLFNLLFPHPSLFFLIFMMACASYTSTSEEIFEKLAAVFSLLYSIRIFRCLHYPSINKSER